MSDNKTLVWLFALVILAVFLFAGDPDVTDVIIDRIARQP